MTSLTKRNFRTFSILRMNIFNGCASYLIIFICLKGKVGHNISNKRIHLSANLLSKSLTH